MRTRPAEESARRGVPLGAGGCGGNASAVFERPELGMKYGIPDTSDEVRLTTLFLAFRE